jgi:AhpD family alkylhydroperoxidase
MAIQVSKIKQLVKELDEEKKRISQALPDVYGRFRELVACMRKDGALPAKVKELIAVAIGVANGCDTCIISHIGHALEFGATLEEISEAASVALVMNGGEALAHLPIALRVAEELRGKY